MTADHRVRVAEITDADGSEFFILCSCGFVSLPSVWRPVQVGPALCDVAELERRMARNRVIWSRACAAQRERGTDGVVGLDWDRTSGPCGGRGARGAELPGTGEVRR